MRCALAIVRAHVCGAPAVLAKILLVVKTLDPLIRLLLRIDALSRSWLRARGLFVFLFIVCL
jgi:hypothetical protein